MPVYKKSIRLLLLTLLAYGVLATTNLGEFWPFSIYPMFSQAGHPWSRAAIRDVSLEEGTLSWEPVSMADLPGTPYPTHRNGLDHTDLANFVSKTQHWDSDRVAGLARMFHDQLEGRRLLVMRADGHIDENDVVTVTFTPYVLLDRHGAVLNPVLPR